MHLPKLIPWEKSYLSSLMSVLNSNEGHRPSDPPALPSSHHCSVRHQQCSRRQCTNITLQDLCYCPRRCRRSCRLRIMHCSKQAHHRQSSRLRRLPCRYLLSRGQHCHILHALRYQLCHLHNGRQQHVHSLQAGIQQASWIRHRRLCHQHRKL